MFLSPLHFQILTSVFLCIVQSVNISAATWVIVEKAVEPRKMFVECANRNAYIDHSEERADAHNLPFP